MNKLTKIFSILASLLLLGACVDEFEKDFVETQDTTQTRSTTAISQPYVKENGDVIAIPRLNRFRAISPQLPNMCVTTIMKYANNCAFGGNEHEGTYTMWYYKKYKIMISQHGVSISHIWGFVNTFFKIEPLSTFKNAIDSHRVVMTDVPSQISDSSHCILVVGYKENGDLIYMDPETGIWETANINYLAMNYRIALSGIK